MENVFQFKLKMSTVDFERHGRGRSSVRPAGGSHIVKICAEIGSPKEVEGFELHPG